MTLVVSLLGTDAVLGMGTCEVTEHSEVLAHSDMGKELTHRDTEYSGTE